MHPKKHTLKSILLLVSLLLILFVTVGGTLAYLATNTPPVKNTFTPSTVTTEIIENFENNVKTNVAVKNTGNTEAYIRAAVIITWQDEQGNVYGQKPVEGDDYTITMYDDDTETANDSWKLAADGFYYWVDPVAADGETGTLIVKCEPAANRAPDGYYLCVEILGSGIQSQPTTVVTTQWNSGVDKIDADGKTLVIKTEQGGTNG